MASLKLCRMAVAVSLGMAGMGLVSATAAEVDPGLAKELTQYVRAARQAGADEARIRRDAISAGWPAPLVDASIASSRNGDTDAREAAGTALVAGAPRPPAEPARGAGQPAPVSTPAPNAAKDRHVPDDYQIGAGDVLQIAVWREPDASVPSVVVRPDGKIAMPLIKEVEVAGLTPLQAEKTITDKLSTLINGVDVTVIVTKIESKKIYVLGAVNKEGTIPYTYRMSVMQALSEAGGLNDYAKRKKIYVLRHESGKEARLPFNYEAVIKGEKMEQNILLAPGDTIVVPQ